MGSAPRAGTAAASGEDGRGDGGIRPLQLRFDHSLVYREHTCGHGGHEMGFRRRYGSMHIRPKKGVDLEKSKAGPREPPLCCIVLYPYPHLQTHGKQ